MRCNAITKKDTKCSSQALKGEEFCYWHSNLVSEAEKLEARKKGGKNSAIKQYPLPALDVSSIQDVPALTVKIMNEVRAGKLQAREASVLSSLITNLTKAFDTADFEKKLRELERKMGDELDETEKPIDFEGWNNNNKEPSNVKELKA